MATVADRMIAEIAPSAKLHDYDISYVHHLITDTLDSLNLPTKRIAGTVVRILQSKLIDPFFIPGLTIRVAIKYSPRTKASMTIKHHVWQMYYLFTCTTRILSTKDYARRFRVNYETLYRSSMTFHLSKYSKNSRTSKKLRKYKRATPVGSKSRWVRRVKIYDPWKTPF